MIEQLGKTFTHLFLKYMPNAFVFALILTIMTSLGAVVWLGTSPIEIVTSWYQGFFDLLGFAMQIVLIVVTGLSIALSPLVKRGIDGITRYIKTPKQVYFLVVLIGMLLSLISFGWVVIAAVLARELAVRVKGVNYPFLIACVYFSNNTWVLGMSSSIPLLLNTEGNFLIDTGILSDVIPMTYTLLSSLNLTMVIVLVVGGPLIMLFLYPRSAEGKELSDLMSTNAAIELKSIEEEAADLKLPFKSLSDQLNNSVILQMLIVLMGFTYVIFHFITKGLDLNFNIMIFIFLIIGMLLHKSPSRYMIAMKRASENISGILFQYPFYAGIMGIMLYTGLGEKLGQVMASVATQDSYPFFAYLTGAFINFAIPSAGGEFAVIGPSLISAVQELGAGLPESDITAMISRASLSVAYGESLSNMLHPFYLLIIMPVLGRGVNLQARDVIGFLVIPFVVFFIVQSFLVVWLPL